MNLYIIIAVKGYFARYIGGNFNISGKIVESVKNSFDFYGKGRMCFPAGNLS